MSDFFRNSGFKLGELENGDAAPTIVSPEEVRSQSEGGGLDALYFVTNRALHDKVIHVLDQGEDDGKFDVVELREVASRRTTRIGEFDDSETAYEVMVENIDRLTGELRELEETAVSEITSNYPITQPADVLYLRLRPYRRKVTVVPESTEIGMQTLDLNEEIIACSGEICVLKPPSQTDLTTYANDYSWHPEYLQMILQSNIVLFQLLPATKGGTRPRVPFDKIMDVKIPWPDEKIRNELVEGMIEFQEDLKQLKKKYNNMMGPDIFDGIGASSYNSEDTKLIMEGLDDRFVTLLMEADLLPESFSSDPFDQMS